ncbi:MAG: Ig-like domain-containing protein [Catenulispora sp.]
MLYARIRAGLSVLLSGGAMVGALIGGSGPVQATTASVLTMSGSSVSGPGYVGTQPQSFTIVGQADGSFGIRNMYSGLALDMNGGTVSGKTYNGTQPQSFELVRQNDGSWGIRAFYPGLATVPQAPSARNDAVATTAGDPVTVDVLANDSNTGGNDSAGLTLTSVSAPADGTATVSNGRAIYTPAPGYTGCDTFTYTARNLFGQQTTATVHVATGAANNTTPTPITGTALTASGSSATASSYAASAGQSFTLVRQNDGSWGIRNQADNTVLTLRGTTVTFEAYQGLTGQSFTTVAQSDGSIGIRNMYSGTAVTITGTAVTGAPYIGAATQSLQLVDQGDGTYAVLTYYGSTQVTQNPQARPDAAVAQPGSPVTIDVLANDSNAGTVGASGLTLTSVSIPANGTVSIQGSQIVYTPNNGYSGCDSFTYTAVNALGQTTTAQVAVATPQTR